jgi:hypothetical protein
MPHPNDPSHDQCPDCAPVSRRQFIRTTTGALGAVGALGVVGLPRLARAAPSAATTAERSSETLVAQLYGSLNEEQKKAICFPFDHELRLKVDNNWFITKQHIADLLSPDQQDLVRQIFMGMHSPEYAQKVYDQVEHDGGGKGTFGHCSVALFGEPDKGGSGDRKFEFVLTGRHCTRRCDGNSVAGAAFGGPIFYGHAAEGFNEPATHPGNAYWFQALRANEVFKALDGKQQKLALLRSEPRKEEGTKTVALSGKKQGLAGIPLTELSADQKGLVRKVMADLLAPFRKADADEALKMVEAGGFDNLHMAFYKNMDIGQDGVWDVWQLEGPAMVWYFRGAPHVHTWVNIREPGNS